MPYPKKKIPVDMGDGRFGYRYTTCNVVHPIEEFRVSSCTCPECWRANRRAANQKWKLKNPEKVKALRALRKPYHDIKRREWHLKFGWSKRNGATFSVERYDRMIASQKGCCAICGDKMKRPHIDHDHTTKQVRELLCHFCNIGLGFFKDDQNRMFNAIAYLRKHSANPISAGVA